MKVKKMYPDAVLPVRKTSGAAGYDLSIHSETPVMISLGETKKIGTGIAMEIPEGYVGLLALRSSTAKKHGVMMPDHVGIIDSDYRGEIFVCLKNVEGGITYIQPGTRIAQIVIVPCLCEELEVVDTLSETGRGSGGFGSTGTGKE